MTDYQTVEVPVREAYGWWITQFAEPDTCRRCKFVVRGRPNVWIRLCDNCKNRYFSDWSPETLATYEDFKREVGCLFDIILVTRESFERILCFDCRHKAAIRKYGRKIVHWKKKISPGMSYRQYHEILPSKSIQKSKDLNVCRKLGLFKAFRWLKDSGFDGCVWAVSLPEDEAFEAVRTLKFPPKDSVELCHDNLKVHQRVRLPLCPTHFDRYVKTRDTFRQRDYRAGKGKRRPNGVLFSIRRGIGK